MTIEQLQEAHNNNCNDLLMRMMDGDKRAASQLREYNERGWLNPEHRSLYNKMCDRYD